MRVPGALSLDKVHHALQIALGWTNSHLHQFLVGEERYGMLDPDDDWRDETIDERKVRLEQIASTRSKFVYEYDFGDGWEHDVVVEGVEEVTDLEWTPVCLDGRRACPPEDCGGSYGYANLIKILANPRHPEHAEMKEWAPPDFSPEHFDLPGINKELRSVAARWRPRTPGRLRTKRIAAAKPANE
jgi:hypothetical protein